MTTLEAFLVVSVVLNVIAFVLTAIMSYNMITMKTYINQMHLGLGNLLNRVMGIEQILNKMAIGFTEMINATGNVISKIETNGRSYRTADGKYMADSVEDLISKIRQDNNEKEYFSEEDINKLRSMFEDDEDDSDEDEK